MESVLQFVERHPIKQVLSVRLAIGELTCVESEQLKFCYDSVTRETVMEGAELEIERVSATVKCPGCSYTGPPKYWMESVSNTPVATLQCPQCGGTTELQQGHECAIKSIRYLT